MAYRIEQAYERNSIGRKSGRGAKTKNHPLAHCADDSVTEKYGRWSVKRYSQFCPGFLKTAFTYFVDEVDSFEDVMTTTEAENVILRMNNPAIPEIDRYKGVINAKLIVLKM